MGRLIAMRKGLLLGNDPLSDAASIDFPFESLADVGVKSVSYFQELGSTNSWGLERIALSSEPTPWLIYAQSQTAGRGRGENRWWSETGSLTFSLVVDTEVIGLPASLWPRLSMAVGIAICHLLERAPWQLPMQIKWPNDVYVQGKKLGGILIEHSGSHLVIGVGLNVNQRFTGAPPEVESRATSLLLEMRAECNALLLLVDLVKEILSAIPKVNSEELDLAYEAGERNFLQWRKVRVRQGATSKEGICTGIDLDGALLLNSDTGQERVLSGTVEIVDR